MSRPPPSPTPTPATRPTTRLRADGNQLRARVVGEGGNLGFTQRGRIEFARAGGRINTDAIDNSAGVDTSDHEVNIKILLDHAVQAKQIDVAHRNSLLASVTDEVAALVLRDNYEQNVLLGIGRHGARSLVSVHRRLIKELEKAGELHRDLEALPTDKELAAREAEGVGLSSPELAVLTAYVKISLAERLGASTLPDEPWFRPGAAVLLPAPDRRAVRRPAWPSTRCTARSSPPAWSTTWSTGAARRFVFRAQEETAADAAQIARAYTVVREVFGLEKIWADLEALDNQVGTDAQHIGYREVRRTMDRAVRWLVDVRFPISDVAAEIERFGPTVAALTPKVPELLRGRERENLYAEVDRLVGHGLPRDLALQITYLLTSFLLLDVVEIAVANDRPAAKVADLHFALSERVERR